MGHGSRRGRIMWSLTFFAVVPLEGEEREVLWGEIFPIAGFGGQGQVFGSILGPDSHAIQRLLFWLNHFQVKGGDTRQVGVNLVFYMYSVLLVCLVELVYAFCFLWAWVPFFVGIQSVCLWFVHLSCTFQPFFEWKLLLKEKKKSNRFHNDSFPNNTLSK